MAKGFDIDALIKKGYTFEGDKLIPPKLESPYMKQQKAVNNGEMPGLPITKVFCEEVKQQLDETTHLGIHSSPLVVFNIEPMGAVRMTKSDQWKLDPFHKDPKKRQRKPVTRYFKFKRDIKAQAEQNGFKLPENDFHAVFIVPMPHSWSQKKKNQMNGAPHKQKPDLDNMIKAVKDSLCDEDKSVWDYRLTKYWGVAGKIIIYPINKLV